MRALELMEELSDARASLDGGDFTLTSSVALPEAQEKDHGYRDSGIIELGNRRCMLDASGCIYELPSWE